MMQYQNTHAHCGPILLGSHVADGAQPSNADRQNQRLAIVEDVVTLDRQKRTVTRAKRADTESRAEPEDDAESKRHADCASHPPNVALPDHAARRRRSSPPPPKAHGPGGADGADSARLPLRYLVQYLVYMTNALQVAAKSDVADQTPSCCPDRAPT